MSAVTFCFGFAVTVTFCSGFAVTFCSSFAVTTVSLNVVILGAIVNVNVSASGLHVNLNLNSFLLCHDGMVELVIGLIPDAAPADPVPNQFVKYLTKFVLFM